MIPHEISIGDIIYDDYNGEWGVVCVIHSPNSGITRIKFESDMSDVIIGYTPCIWDGREWIEQQGYCETEAHNAYPHIPNKYFWGCDICLEINKDEFDEEHDYDYFCPTRNENCWEFEVSN